MILLFLIVFLFCSALQWIACNGVLGYIEMHTGAMQCTRWRGNAMLSGEMQMSSMHTLHTGEMQCTRWRGNTMHTGEMNCTVEKCNAMHSVHCTLEKEGMQCKAQWGNAKQCTMHTGGGSAMHPWHLSGQPLHLVDEMLMPWAVQSFSVQWRVQFGRCTGHHVVYVVNQGCSAVKLLHKTKSNAVLVEFVKLSYSD